MSKVAYLVRHGQHQGNVLTPAGVARMQAAAEAIKADLATRGVDVTRVRMFSSQEPRAVMSAGVIAATLGLKVTGGQLEAFNPAAGLGKAIAEARLPKVGEGFASAWREKDATAAAEIGVEFFTSVHIRSNRACADLMRECGGIPIIATHDGVIEPCVNYDEGADCHDMVEGEVAVIEETETTVRVFFLNAKLPE